MQIKEGEISMKRKVGYALCGLIAVLLSLFLIYDNFIAFKPVIIFQRFRVNIEEDYNFEAANLIMAYDEQRPVPATFAENEINYLEWSNDIFDDLYYNYMAPTDVKLSAAINQGKVTFTYQGYVTTKQGEKLDYFKEATFDFIKVPEMKNFDKVYD